MAAHAPMPMNAPIIIQFRPLLNASTSTGTKKRTTPHGDIFRPSKKILTPLQHTGNHGIHGSSTATADVTHSTVGLAGVYPR